MITMLSCINCHINCQQLVVMVLAKQEVVTACVCFCQGAVTSITEPAAADMTYAFGLFYGGLVQLLAGMWEMYKVRARLPWQQQRNF